MFDVAGGVRCREDVAQRRGYSDRSNAAHSTSLPPSHDSAWQAGQTDWGYSTGPTPRHSSFDFAPAKLIGRYRIDTNASRCLDAIRDSRIAAFDWLTLALPRQRGVLQWFYHGQL